MQIRDLHRRRPIKVITPAYMLAVSMNQSRNMSRFKALQAQGVRTRPVTKDSAGGIAARLKLNYPPLYSTDDSDSVQLFSHSTSGLTLGPGHFGIVMTLHSHSTSVPIILRPQFIHPMLPPKPQTTSSTGDAFAGATTFHRLRRVHRITSTHFPGHLGIDTLS